jgi:predicted amidohydrolase YtcJ
VTNLLIHNATLLSFQEGYNADGNDAIAINGNTIEAIGTYEELKNLIQPGTQVIDALGNTLMPGFNDSHIHIWKVGNLKTFMLDVRGVKSKEELVQLIRDYNQKNPHLQWITARGFNEAAWQEKSIPTKIDLDKVTTHKPIYLIRTCAHIAVCNSKALEMAGIDNATIAPVGGTIQLGEDGKPTGILNETALGLITNKIPPYGIEDLKIMIRACREELYQYGITAATDPAVEPMLIKAYKEMDDTGELGFRLNALPIILPDGSNDAYPIPEPYSSDFMQINTVKFFADGGLSGQTSAQKKHYKNSTEQGVLRLNKTRYTQLSRQCMEKGLGVATHAIGDAAIEMVIDVYEELHKDFPALIKRIEHLGLPEKKHLEAMAVSNIACSMQTIFLDELGKNFIQYLDEDYLSQCYPVKSVLQQGILMALSSDAPVVKNFNPFKGISAAITRITNEGEVIAPNQSISMAAALKAYTISAATIGGESRFGSLQKGQLADFILLDKNPLTTPINEITQIKVLKTFLDGKEVWSREM